MGAAASVKQLYSDSLAWFKNYIDTETYLKDFKEFDAGGEGAISFVDFQKRILEKAKANTEDAKFWGMLVQNGPVLKVAHKSASLVDKSVINVSEYKSFLVHLFVASVLWRYFDFADNAFDDTGKDQQLTFPQFKLAVHAFCRAHAGEELDEQTIMDDFHLLDTNLSNTIGFMEICRYTSNFIDPTFHSKREKPIEDTPIKTIQEESTKADKVLGVRTAAVESTTGLMSDLAGGNKFYNMLSPEEKSKEAMLQLNRVLEYNDAIMQEEKAKLLANSSEVGQTT